MIDLAEWAEALDEVGLADLDPRFLHFAERKGSFCWPQAPMHDDLYSRLRERGVVSMFTHQAEAYDAAARGQDLIIVTGTNSGKSLCYQAPVLQQMLISPAARALFLYPTKALARDQSERLKSLVEGWSLPVGVYDGDTKKSERSAIRKAARLLVSNPDMLHVGMLPQHELWTPFWRSLQTIVIDEVHTYRGVFGSHVAGVIRRLLRLCAWHGARPNIIATSATIEEPARFFQALTGREPTVIAVDGSSQAEKFLGVLSLEPAMDENLEMGLGPNVLTGRLLASLCRRGLRTLAFSRSRAGAELVLRSARRWADEHGGPKPSQLESYRAGYLAGERRQIERDLLEGRLLGLSSTNALELGIDVGDLDVVLMNGFPGSITAYRQQSGRAGRGLHQGHSMLLAHPDPLEGFYARNPERLALGRTEAVRIALDNPIILGKQVRCAAFERPISRPELDEFASGAQSVAEAMVDSGELIEVQGRFYVPGFDSPAMGVSLRGVGDGSVTLWTGGEPLGSMEKWRAVQFAHPGAIYLHRGDPYVVEELDLERGAAYLKPIDSPQFTEPVLQSLVEPSVEIARVQFAGMDAVLCGLHVTDTVLGYRLKGAGAGEPYMELDLPAREYDTLGCVFELPLNWTEQESTPGRLHALEHTLLAVAPALVGCDRHDLGSSWFELHPASMRPVLAIYDAIPGGVGLAEGLFGMLERWFCEAHDGLKSCPCLTGCPNCLYLSQCGMSNHMLDKPGVLEVMPEMIAGLRDAVVRSSQ